MSVSKIIKEIENGKTLYICTRTKAIKITAKTLASFKRAGCVCLKDRKVGETGFYVARGKHFDYVGQGCKVYFEDNE